MGHSPGTRTATRTGHRPVKAAAPCQSVRANPSWSGLPRRPCRPLAFRRDDLRLARAAVHRGREGPKDHESIGNLAPASYPLGAVARPENRTILEGLAVNPLVALVFVRNQNLVLVRPVELNEVPLRHKSPRSLCDFSSGRVKGHDHRHTPALRWSCDSRVSVRQHSATPDR